MADFGEELPYDAVLYSGVAASSYHNQYPEVWARLNREAIQEAGLADEGVFFTRSAYIAARAIPLFSGKVTNW